MPLVEVGRPRFHFMTSTEIIQALILASKKQVWTPLFRKVNCTHRPQNRGGSSAPWFALDEFFDEKFRQARSVMSDDHVLIEQIVQQTAHADRVQFSDIHAYWRGSARAISARDFRRDDLIACHDPVEELAARVFVNRAHVIR